MRSGSWIIPVLAGFVAMVGGTECIPTRPTDYVTDRSDFKAFHFEQLSALGFCPEIDMPYQATITRQADGSDLLEMTVFEAGSSDPNDCSSEYIIVDPGQPCPVMQELPARTLTAEESQRLRQAFAQVHVKQVYFEPMFVDPCMYVLFRWDDWSLLSGVAGYVSGYVAQIDQTDYQKIVPLLNALR